MDSSYPIAGPEELLAHRDFLSGLVRSLVFEHEQAEDYVQETWAYAIRKPPRSGPGLRAWLAVVARNFIRQDRRARGRRAGRETAAARPEAVPSTADAVAREQARRRVVDAVLALAEPYRTVVVLRYLEDLPPREIAKRTGAPVETVRTRLKRALALLRNRFDDEHQGDRRAWCVALLPLIDHRVTGGLLLMGAKAKIAAVVVLLALVAGVAWLALPPDTGPEGSPDRPEDTALRTGEEEKALPPADAGETAAVEEPAPQAVPKAMVGVAFTDEDGRALSADEVVRRYAAAGIPLAIRAVPEALFTGKEMSDLIRTRIEPPDRWSTEIDIVRREEGLGLAEAPEPGRYRLFLGRPGAAPMTTAPLAVAADGEVEVTVPLPTRAETLRRRLVDADTGAPLAGATVTPYFEYGDDQLFLPGPALFADAQGGVEIPRLEDAVRGRGRQPVWWAETDTHLGRVTITGDGEEVRISRFAVVTGTAYLYSGQLAAGRRVCWVGKGKSSTATVDGDGRFRLAPVAVDPRNRSVRVGLIEDLAAFRYREVRVEPQAGGTVEVVIGEPSGQMMNAALSGRVTAGGRPVAGAFVIVTTPGVGKAFVQTGPDGTWRKDDVKPGEVRLRFYFGDPRAVDDFYASRTEPLTLAVGNDRTFDLDLPAGVFQVKVVDAETGEPVPGAVAVGRPEDREAGKDRFPGFTYRPGWGLRVGEDGTALLLAMLPGQTHSLFAFAEGYERLETKGHLPGTADRPEEVTLRLVRKK